MHSRSLPRQESLGPAEFRVFSQFGEDGIIQYLLGKVAVENRFFVEIGVQNYVESNTRFLLMQDNWRGAVVDGSARDIDYIRNDNISWRHHLDAHCSFVTAENVNQILDSTGAPKELGLLSIDIDGNDYWVWKAISSYQPAIVICEYNSLFGPEAAVTIPYAQDFFRTNSHYSNLYFGASLAALCDLAEEKGYHFVGANSSGNNAFFVRKDLSGNLAVHSPKSGYVEALFRESRDPQGNLTFLDRSKSLDLIASCELIDVKSGKKCEAGKILGRS